MRFSQESFYGIAVLTALAERDRGRPVPLEDLAEACDIPRTFLAKILQKLVRGGVVVSSRGRQRGYALAEDPETITLKDVLEITEGADLFRRCFFSSRPCKADPLRCPLHQLGESLRAEVVARLSALTIAALAAGAHA
jgi:Rrf2 family protein